MGQLVGQTNKGGLMPNYTTIFAISGNEQIANYRLSPTTVNLCLALLGQYCDPWAWFSWDGSKPGALTAEEIDEAEAATARAVYELLTEVHMFKPGMVMPWVSDGPRWPEGWLYCDGTEYDVDAHPALYEEIGTSFGGTVGLTFCVPDLRGKAVQGVDPSAGDWLATQVGEKMQTDVPQHRHGYKYNIAAGAGSAKYSLGSGGASIDYTENTGTAGGVDQRGPRLCLYWIIYAGEG